MAVLILIIMLLTSLKCRGESNIGSISVSRALEDFDDGEISDLLSYENVTTIPWDSHSGNISVSVNIQQEHFNPMIINDEIFSTGLPQLNSSIYNKSVDPLIEEKSQSVSSIKTFVSLFQTFAFKGIGFTFMKSILNLQSFGFGFKIPVTAHFPDYDCMVHFPKVATIVGCSFPWQLRCAVSCSVPVQTLVYVLALLLGRRDLASLANPKATDSIRRIGFTYSIRYKWNGEMVSVIGPWTNFIPSKAMMSAALPYILVAPAATLALLDAALVIIRQPSLNDSSFKEVDPSEITPANVSTARSKVRGEAAVAAEPAGEEERLAGASVTGTSACPPGLLRRSYR